MIKNGKEFKIKFGEQLYHCPISLTIGLIGGKWKTIILWYLREQPVRFGELGRMIPDITEKMLSLQLRQLEADGLVGRKVYPEVPPRVEYFLTKDGKSLLPLLEEVSKWGLLMMKRKGELIETGRAQSAKKAKKQAG